MKTFRNGRARQVSIASLQVPFTLNNNTRKRSILISLSHLRA